jgi:hypothetical protein
VPEKLISLLTSSASDELGHLEELYGRHKIRPVIMVARQTVETT